MSRPDPRIYTMSEKALLAAVQQLARDMGLWTYHPHDSRRSEPGWPDLVILGPDGAIFAELKAHGGRLSPEQRHVGRLLTRAGLAWCEWRPRDLIGGDIAAQLARIAGLTKEAA